MYVCMYIYIYKPYGHLHVRAALERRRSTAATGFETQSTSSLLFTVANLQLKASVLRM